MAYTPCCEEVYLDIRNQSGCLCVMSFLKARLYCNKSLKNVYFYLYSSVDDGPTCSNCSPAEYYTNLIEIHRMSKFYAKFKLIEISPVS